MTPYTDLPKRFIAHMREFGVADESIVAMTVTNLARAFRIVQV